VATGFAGGEGGLVGFAFGVIAAAGFASGSGGLAGFALGTAGFAAALTGFALTAGVGRAAGLGVFRARRLAGGFFATFFRTTARLPRTAGLAAERFLPFALALVFLPAAMGSLRK
jgi:hypothetical protein